LFTKSTYSDCNGFNCFSILDITHFEDDQGRLSSIKGLCVVVSVFGRLIAGVSRIE